MNKNLTLKLLLLLLSLSLISCGKKEIISKSNNETQDATSNIKEENNENQDTTSNTKEWNNENQDTTSPGLFSVAGRGLNEVPGICEYSLDDVNVTTRIKPSIISKTSSHYDVKTDGNTYVDIIFNVQNLSNELKIADDIISAKIKIKNNEYSCFPLVESIDGTSLENSTSINSLETRRIHYAAEVPVIDLTNTEVGVILTINGKDFSNKFILDGSQDSQEDVTQNLTEEEYYVIIKEAKQRQQDYVDSIDDPKVKQSVQSPLSAAIAASSGLYIKYPNDIDTIDVALKRVVDEMQL